MRVYTAVVLPVAGASYRVLYVSKCKNTTYGVRCAMLVECCFTSTETVGLLGTGAQDGHLDFHTAPELCVGTGSDVCDELVTTCPCAVAVQGQFLIQ